VEYRFEQSDVDMLRNSNMSDIDVKHCIKVAEKALEIARRTGGKSIWILLAVAHCSMISARPGHMKVIIGRSVPNSERRSAFRKISRTSWKNISEAA
jgi:hypothetical protein